MFYIYSMPGCGACNQAAELCAQKGLQFQKIDLMDVDGTEQKKLQSIAGTSFRSVPQIFAEKDDHLIYLGGLAQLKDYVASADKQDDEAPF